MILWNYKDDPDVHIQVGSSVATSWWISASWYALHAFFTLNSADLQWLDLYLYMPKTVEEPINYLRLARQRWRIVLNKNSPTSWKATSFSRCDLLKTSWLGSNHHCIKFLLGPRLQHVYQLASSSLLVVLNKCFTYNLRRAKGTPTVYARLLWVGHTYAGRPR